MRYDIIPFNSKGINEIEPIIHYDFNKNEIVNKVDEFLKKEEVHCISVYFTGETLKKDLTIHKTPRLHIYDRKTNLEYSFEDFGLFIDLIKDQEDHNLKYNN